MDDRTLTALKGSIAKWEAIVAGTGQDNGSHNCPLCLLFHEDFSPHGTNCCVGCPVMAKTGQWLCAGTPYADWSELHPVGSGPYVVRTKGQRAAAQAELDFLKSMLPPDADLQTKE